jgi:hypothetical protein
VFWIAAELEDVPLRDAHVLENLPRGVRQTCYALAAEFRWKIRDEILERNVRASTAKDVEQMIAEGFVGDGLLFVHLECHETPSPFGRGLG